MRQQTEKMKEYEEKSERAGILDSQRVRGKIDTAHRTYRTPRGCPSIRRHERSGFCEYIYCRVTAFCRKELALFF